MGTVGTSFSMSLDGFIAQPDGEVGPLFDWYFQGETNNEIVSGDGSFTVTDDGAKVIQEASQAVGALVTGRKLFDFTHAWGGRHPLNVPIVVVTHHVETVPEEWTREGSVFTFVTDGVESAIQKAKEIAGDKNVAVASASVAQQCITAGLLDEIAIDLAPVLLCEGIRLFDHLGSQHIRLESTSVRPAAGVTHLSYRIVKYAI